jgi:Zinc binding domain
MSTHCCSATVDDRLERRCPVSGSRGVVVDRRTVKALLTEQALGRLGSGDYCFCPDEACDVVYFDAEGQRFTTGDVRVPVWQKLPFGSRLICYCFGESEASIRSEFESSHASNAVARVRAHIAADRCACEVRNPRGACCLGDLTAAVQRVDDAVATARDAR